MEVEATIFLGAVIIGATQFIKYLVPKVNGAATIAVAVVLGVLVAAFDTQIGVVDITIAEGVMAGLSAVGITTAASKLGSSANSFPVDK